MRNKIRIPQMMASTMIQVATEPSGIFPWNTVFTDTPSGLCQGKDQVISLQTTKLLNNTTDAFFF